MRGVDYIVDEKGARKAVMIDLRRWGKLWEDFQDIMAAQARADEPTVPWDKVKAELKQDDA